MKYTPKDLERFWSKINRTDAPDNCWNRNASTSRQKGGYGTFTKNGKTRHSHKIAYEVSFGEIPIGLCVLHTCDNTLCCNPKHLFLGTQLENIADRVSKGRTASNQGEKNGRSKLTRDQENDIRQRYFKGGISYGKLARDYKVSKQTIRDIILFKIWK